MSAGKIVSQAGHAYLGAFCAAPAELQSEYHANGLGTKVCLSAGINKLLITLEQAERAGVPCALITDSGCPDFFGGKPTITALGVGPCTREQAVFLRRLQLKA